MSGVLGGALSTLVTIPLDVMVAQIQQAKTSGVPVKFWSEFARHARSGHVVSGFVPRVAHVALTTAMMRTLTSMVYALLD